MISRKLLKTILAVIIISIIVITAEVLVITCSGIDPVDLAQVAGLINQLLIAALIVYLYKKQEELYEQEEAV
jgi:ABC-type uncharacterized transport system permease subunit